MRYLPSDHSPVCSQCISPVNVTQRPSIGVLHKSPGCVGSAVASVQFMRRSDILMYIAASKTTYPHKALLKIRFRTASAPLRIPAMSRCPAVITPRKKGMRRRHGSADRTIDFLSSRSAVVKHSRRSHSANSRAHWATLFRRGMSGGTFSIL